MVPVPPDARFPRRADGFELESELGRGGMGVVYLARELVSGRRVALKVLPASLAGSSEAFERFQREAVLAASISDARCVFVYGAHQFEGSPAIAMELVRGQTLEHVIKRGEPIPVRQAVRWTIELLEGLDAAHRAGVLHRDVKPSNCFVTQDGQVKIGDFGLSRSLETDVHLTQSGSFLGSPLYAAPEQIKGRKVDERSDLYSAAATLYALLTGRAPYSGSNLGEVLSRILSEPPESPRTHRPDLPRPLEKVLLKAMERDPEDRYQDLAAFRAALHPYSVEVEAGTLPRRFAAYVLDALAVGLLASVLSSGLAVLFREQLQIDPSSGRMHATWPILIGFAETLLYFALLEGLCGRTFGKWLLGLRTVHAKSGETAFWPATWRAVLFTLPVALGTWAGFETTEGGLTIGVRFATLSTLLPPALRLLMFATARKTNGWRAAYEWASATRVLATSLPFPMLRRGSTAASRTLVEATAFPAVLGPYRIRGLVAETPAGRLLEAEDAVLARRVWLLSCEGTPLVLDEARRQVARRGRLHWLGSLEHDGSRFEVFEAPGGDALAPWSRAQAAVDWPTLLRILLELAEELEITREEGRRETFTLEQVWIDRWGTVRLLDVPVDTAEPLALADVELLARAARGFMPAGAVLPLTLPGRAEAVMQRLLGNAAPFASAAEARAALAELAQGEPEVTRKRRALQLGMSGGALALASLVLLGVMSVLFLLEDQRTQVRSLLDDLRAGRSLRTGEALDAEDVHAREVRIRQMMAIPGARDDLDAFGLENRPQLDRLLAQEEALDLRELQAAADHLKRKGARTDDLAERFFEDTETGLRASFDAFAAVWIVLAVVGAAFLRGGLWLRLFGTLLRDSRGRRAGYLRCMLRSLVAWSPLLLILLSRLVPWIAPGLAWLLIPAAFLLLAAGAAFAFWRPQRGLPDLVAGTRLVPR